MRYCHRPLLSLVVSRLPPTKTGNPHTSIVCGLQRHARLSNHSLAGNPAALGTFQRANSVLALMRMRNGSFCSNSHAIQSPPTNSRSAVKNRTRFLPNNAMKRESSSMRSAVSLAPQLGITVHSNGTALPSTTTAKTSRLMLVSPRSHSVRSNESTHLPEALEGSSAPIARDHASCVTLSWSKHRRNWCRLASASVLPKRSRASDLPHAAS